MKPPLGQEQIREYLSEVPQRELRKREGQDTLERTFQFPDFATALAFTNRVGMQAEAEGHHPAILTEWGRVAWWTHKIKGLHLNDFIMAARTDGLYMAGSGAKNS